MYEDRVRLKGFIRIVIIAVLAALFISIIWWVSQQSRITITTNGSVNLQTINQKNGEEQFYDNIDEKTTITVKKGDYKLYVTSDTQSYFQIVKTSGFFRTTVVSAELQSENDISFTGSDPSSCDYYNEIYISYTCSSSTDSVKLHRPATDTTPSYPVKNSQPQDLGELGNIFTINNNQYVIVQENNQREFGRNVLYKVSSDGASITYTPIRRLDALNSSYRYYGVPYGQGFVAHSGTLSGLYYYKDVGSETEVEYLSEYLLDVDKSLTSVEVSAKDNYLLITASNKIEINRESNKSTVVMVDAGNKNSYTVDKIISSAEICGISSVCALSDGIFTVYEATDKSLKHKYQVTGVTDFTVKDDSSVIIALDSRVVEMNIESMSGKTIFWHKGFGLVGLNQNFDGSLLAQIKSQSSTNTVLIGSELSEGNGILGVLEKLENSQFVDSVSVFQKSVFISPNLGEFVFLESEGYFDYSPEEKRLVNAEITKITSSAEAIASGFKFISTVK